MNNAEKASRKRKSIRSLERYANQGNLKALFQLAEYYKYGKYVENNNDLADKYYEKALKIFQKQVFQVSSVKLTNFRIFNNNEVDFCTKHNNETNLTVIIGNNGAGKTTICDSVVKCLSWVIKRIVSTSGNGSIIDKSDINNFENSAEYASIITKFDMSHEVQYEMELSKAKDGSNSTRKNQLLDIGQLADIYRYANSRDDQFNFPIMAFYSIERAQDINKKDVGEFDEISEYTSMNKFDAYQNALNGTADFKFFFRWFKYLEDLDNASSKGNKDILGLLNELEIKVDSDAIIKLKRFSQIDEDDRYKYRKLIDCIINAIKEFMPEFSSLRIQRTPRLDMLIDKKGITLSVLQLSQGEKSLMALIADLVRRLVLLNPSLDNPLEGNGIVLIDEIDLHLHPEWQQTIISNLLKTFPNIQFIVTTHSPHVLTTVESKSIRILKNGKIYLSPKGSKGGKSSRILKQFFGVDPRPPNDEITIALSEYKDLVYSDKWNSQRAIELRNILNAHFGDEEPDLFELDLYIENKSWEIEIEKDYKNSSSE